MATEYSLHHVQVLTGDPVIPYCYSHYSLFLDASKQPLSSSGRRRTASSSALFDDQLPSADVEPDDVASTSSRDSTTTKLTTEDTEKLKHPVFPWQRGGRSSSTETSASRRKNTLQTTTGIEQPQSNTFKAEALPGSHGPSLNQTSNLASFQQQLLQQQKQFQEQLASFQTESNSAVATARATSTTEIERLQGEVKSTGERVKELEGALERKDGELSDKHVCWTFSLHCTFRCYNVIHMYNTFLHDVYDVRFKLQ